MGFKDACKRVCLLKTGIPSLNKCSCRKELLESQMPELKVLDQPTVLNGMPYH